MKTTTYWHKENPDLTAEVFEDFDLDDGGGVPAMINQIGEDGEAMRLYALIRLEEWSDEALTAPPDHVPSTGFLVIYGRDEEVTYQFVIHEATAVKCVNAGAVGYVAVSVNTKYMKC